MANGRDYKRDTSIAKTSTKHPYASIQHRVIDSPAWPDMTFSAHALALLFARQLTRDNNGHLQAAFKWCKRFGFGSEHTLRAALAELIGHGFIYRTRSHGANGAWAKYAVSWLPITKRDGLFLDGFVACAWRNWQPDEKKSSRQKLPDDSGRKCSFTPEHPAESAGKPTAEIAPYVLIPCRGAVAGGVDLEVDLELRGRSGGGPKIAQAKKKGSPEKPARKACAECGQSLKGKRAHAAFCSPACKVRAWRKRTVRLPTDGKSKAANAA